MDRHRKGYYAAYNAKRKAQGKSIDRHRKGYYHDYNAKHIERLERIGIYINDVEEDCGEEICNPITLSHDIDDDDLDMRCTDYYGIIH